MATAPPEYGHFKGGLLTCLASVENLALEEVERLSEELRRLRGDNDYLRNQLSQQDACLSGKEELKHQMCKLESQADSCGKDKMVNQKMSCVANHSPGYLGEKSRWSAAVQPSDENLSKPPFEARSAAVQQTSDEFISRPAWEVRNMVTSSSCPSKRFYKDTGIAQAVVKSSAFQYGMLLMIILNAIWIAVEMDLNNKPLVDSPPFFQVVEHLFALFFCLEMAVRFCAFDRKWDAIHDLWFIFDFLLVLSMIVEDWILTFLTLAMGGSGIKGLGSLSALRNFRLLRITSMARLCRVVPEFKTMVVGMLNGVRSVATAAVLLLMMTYMFALFLRQMGASTAWGREYFRSVPASMYTLLTLGIFPDNAALLDQISAETWFCGLLYFVFIMFSAVTVMNLLIGILCDVMSRVSAREKEQHDLQTMTDKLESMIKALDTNRNGFVSKAEFESILDNQEALRVLDAVGVDVVSFVEERDFIFGHHSELPFEAFREEVLRFRGTNQATLGSIIATRRFVRWQFDELASKIGTVEMLLLQTLVHEKHSSLSLLPPPPEPLLPD